MTCEPERSGDTSRFPKDTVGTVTWRLIHKVVPMPCRFWEAGCFHEDLKWLSVNFGNEAEKRRFEGSRL